MWNKYKKHAVIFTGICDDSVDVESFKNAANSIGINVFMFLLFSCFVFLCAYIRMQAALVVDQML